MSSKRETIKLVQLLETAARELREYDKFQPIFERQILKDGAEIRKRDNIIDELRDEVDTLKAKIKRLEGGAA